MPQPDKLSKPGWRVSNPNDLRDPLQIGFTIVGVTAMFGGIGWWLDSLFHTFPILLVLGAVTGMFGILYMTYLRLRASDKDGPNGNGGTSSHPGG